MPVYEYKVVPAPAKGEKAKTAKTPESRFALAVETLLNTMGTQGWEFLRAELLPSEERSGLTGSQTVWRNVMVFRRALPEAVLPAEPAMLRVPVATPVPGPGTALGPANAPEPPSAPPVSAVREEQSEPASVAPVSAAREEQPEPSSAEREESRAPGMGIDRVAVKMASATGGLMGSRGDTPAAETEASDDDQTGDEAAKGADDTETEPQPKT